jgi:hypothetical protein
MPDGQLTLYRGDQTLLVDPADYQKRTQQFSKKGWSRTKADPKTPFINYMQSAAKNAGPKGPPGFGETLNRELNAAGETIMGTPGAIKSSFTTPPDSQEAKQLGTDKPGMVGKFALGLARNVGEPLQNAAEWYKREYDLIKGGKQNFGDTVDKMLSVAPEGVGSAAAQEIMGHTLKALPEQLGRIPDPKMMETAVKTAKPIVDSVGKILKGNTRDVTAELEDFRKTVKAKPSPRARDVAAVKHKALQQRINSEWTKLYTGLKDQPTDALAVRRALQKLSEVDPITKKWLADNIKDTASGNAVTVPLWPKVRELSAQLNRDMANPRLDRIHAAEIPEAHEQLEQLLKEAAEAQGMKDQYTRAYSLNRKLENIKYNTAYGTAKNKPSPLFGLGGAIGGLAAGEGTGGGLASALIGKMIGTIIGKKLTNEGWTIPKRSIEGEKAVWRELGEKPPKDINKKVINPAEK